MNSKNISNHINNVLTSLKLPKIDFIVEQTRSPEFGDYATNIALLLAKQSHKNPMEIATEIAKAISKKYPKIYEKVVPANPGFINFTLSTSVFKEVIVEYNNPSYKPQQLPKQQIKKYNVEFVSANPTGALHFGHVRNAYVGDVFCKILAASGHKVVSEYWINDLGNQIMLFEISILARYLELFNIPVTFPSEGYKGKEPKIVALALKEKYGDKFINVKFDEKQGILDPKAHQIINKFGLSQMLKQIKEHLALIGVKIKVWTSENKIYYHSPYLAILKKTTFKKYAYMKDNALWFKSTLGGDDKDRVLIKSDGSPTYFVTDIANHLAKLSRGFDMMVNVWGSDHYGYISRLKYSINTIGGKSSQLEIIQIQMVKMFKNGKELKLSKRSGNSLTIPDMLKMLSVDSSRWFMISQACNTPIAINLDIATASNNTNPVYYVQYAYARICQIIKKFGKAPQMPKAFDLLKDPREHEMIVKLMQFSLVLHGICTNFEIHRLTNYVYDLAKTFHSWYGECHVQNPDNQLLSAQRYYLIKAVGKLIETILKILGISVPQTMAKLKKQK